MSLKLDPGDVLHNGRYEVLEHMRSPRDKEVYLAYDNIRLLGVDRRFLIQNGNAEWRARERLGSSRAP